MKAGGYPVSLSVWWNLEVHGTAQYEPSYRYDPGDVQSPWFGPLSESRIRLRAEVLDELADKYGHIQEVIATRSRG